MNTMKKLLSVLLAAILMLPGMAAFAAADEEEGLVFQTGDFIQFGSYPQSEVKDDALITVLNGMNANWQSYGYYTGNDRDNDGGMVASDYMQFADVPYEGETYRGVRFIQYRPGRTSSSSSAARSGQDENGYITGTTYWFLWEPLRWHVLDPETGLILCETVIDSQPYNNYRLLYSQDIYGNDADWGDASKKYYANNYEKSDIRAWLTDEAQAGSFLNMAFTEAQREKIFASELENKAYGIERSDYNSASTTDKVFLLSWTDAMTRYYGFAGNEREDPARQVKGSDYAKCQGLHVNTENGCSEWRLRTAGSTSAYSCYVDTAGKLGTYCFVNSTIYGIRPALCVDLEYAYTTAEYKATFVADGKTVGTVTYTAETTSIKDEEPEIPPKKGYTCAWSPYTLDVGGVTIEADYTPISYTATFIADGEIVGTVEYTVETTSIKDKEPAVPPKDGCAGVWKPYTLVIDGVTVEADYSPITYTATFVADGETVGTVEYTVETTSIQDQEPAVPTKAGYEGAWKPYTLAVGGVTVEAEYTPIPYTATFIANGETVGTVEYTVETASIKDQEPAVPPKAGYAGAWKPYTLPINGVTVEAEYTPIPYMATFVADGETVGTVAYTVETASIKDQEPAVPSKAGYEGAWKPYALVLDGVTVEAEYTPIPYTATFVANGETVGTVEYTVETASIKDQEPAVPTKAGYEGAWKPYTLALGGVTVEAEYTAVDYIATFIANGEVVGTVGYTTETTSIKDKEPAVPQKDGYEGAWKPYTLVLGGVTVEAEYTLIPYTATFVADGVTVGTVGYTVETASIKDQEPVVPTKAGYEGAWKPYALVLGGVTIEAEYTAIPYTATFIADGETVGTVEYTVETASIQDQEPAVPAKEGCTGMWETYTLALGGVTVHAVYTANTYTVTWDAAGKITKTAVTFGSAITKPADPAKDGYTFTGWTPAIPATMPAQDLTFTAQFTPNKYNAVLMADGRQVDVIPYTYGQKSIQLPAVPEKEGYTGAWPTYTLPVGGVTITAVYTKNSYTVAWNADGKTTRTTVTYGDAIVKPADPVKTGYKFTGWTPAIPATMPAKDLTFTAQFEKIVITGLRIVKTPTKTVYVYRRDKNVDPSGMVLEATYSDGSTKTITDMSACKVSGYSAKPRGDKTVIVEYEGKTAQFTVNVKYVWWQWLILIFLFGWIWY